MSIVLRHLAAVAGAVLLLGCAMSDAAGGMRGEEGGGDSTAGREYVDELTGMKFVLVESGSFEMGSSTQPGAPPHEVTLADYYIGKYEVTQSEWEQVMGSNPATFKGAQNPVEMVSWQDAKDFVEKLNELTGLEYRLPTEAEWEYAARSGGKDDRWSGTSELSELPDFAWFKANSNGTTHPVGTAKPNGLGIHDMSGNVTEWCQDWMSGSYYTYSPAANPSGPSSGTHRVGRGGAFAYSEKELRTTARGAGKPDGKASSLGFRLCIAAGSLQH